MAGYGWVFSGCSRLSFDALKYRTNLLYNFKIIKMKIKLLAFSFMFSMLLFTCSSDKKTNAKSTTTSTAKQSTDCSYSAQKEGIKVNWTAFKTTKKVGVNGSFNNVDTETKPVANSITHLITGSTFKINTSSVNSKNEDRDKKLVSFFFGKFANMSITGLFKNATGNNTSGKGTVNVTMNGIAKDIPYTYIATENEVKINTNIDTDLWNGQSAIASINKACEKLHTGEDGVSKTWKDVDVNVVIPFKKNCK